MVISEVDSNVHSMRYPSLYACDSRKKRFQGWDFDALLSLEAKELVPFGTCHYCSG